MAALIKKLKNYRIIILLLSLLLLFVLLTSIRRPTVVNTFMKTATVNNLLETTKPPLSVNKIHCNPVHIAMVIGGNKTLTYAKTGLKSVIIHRTQPIHFHFIVDSQSHSILDTMFREWQIPHLHVKFYDIGPAMIDQVKWVKNTHYSGIYGMLKLTLPYVLENVDRVISLDTDTLVLGDIGELWAEFDKFNSQQVIGMVGDSSYWEGIRNPFWNVIRKGFNSGVISMWLSRLRKANWTGIWGDVSRECLKKYHRAEAADQDVLNGVAGFHNHLIYILPCQWNVQLNDGARPEPCVRGNVNSVKLAHFNNVVKLQKNHHKCSQELRDRFKEHEKYDAMKLKDLTINCS